MEGGNVNYLQDTLFKYKLPAGQKVKDQQYTHNIKPFVSAI